MATATITATYQGQIKRQDTSTSTINWLSTTRNATTGTNATTFSVGTSTSVRSEYTLQKGTYYSINERVFLFFDLSSINGTITSADLKVYNPSTVSNTDDIDCVEASAWGGDGSSSTLTTSDYDNVAFLGTGPAYAALLSWSSLSYNTFTIGAAGISAMNSDGYLNCALVTEDYDYKGENLTLGQDINFAMRAKDGSNPIYLDITYTPQTGYSHGVNGVGSSSIVSVNTVATASITNIIGVS